MTSVLGSGLEIAQRVGLAESQSACDVEIAARRGRFGTFVARADPSDSAMAAAARSYLDVARGLGLGKAAALRYLEAAPDD